MELCTIAKIENGFVSKFGIPRQSGLSSAESRIVFEPKFRSSEALRGIENFSHLWLIWQFSEGFASKPGGRRGFCATVRPPRLGGNKRIGVFATRSPNRPNPIGLSVVKLLRVEHTADRGDILVVSGADLMNGTPIFDIKPYIAYADAVPTAVGGYSDADFGLDVSVPYEIVHKISPDDLAIITEIIRGDPRPSYQNDPEREYIFDYGGYSVGFKVDEKSAIVTKIEKRENN